MGMSKLHVQTERIDDIPLLVEQQRQMGIAEIIDSTVARHGNRQGLSMGWMVVGWLSYILSQSDHRLSYVEEWATQLLTTLNQLMPGDVRPEDFTDDRLGDALSHLSDDAVWEQIESQLNQRCVQVYDLPTNTARVDTTTVALHHAADNSELAAFGHSKDHRPDLAQLKLMMVTLDPLALPLVTQVLPGNMADDGLYVPAIRATQATLPQGGMLYVGDSKMEALATRAHCAATGDYYLHPLSLKGQQRELLRASIDHVLDSEESLLTDIHDTAGERLLAQGWESSRAQRTEVDGQLLAWQERLWLLYSPSLAAAGYRALDERIDQATAALLALTPQPGRGRRQWRDIEALQAEAAAILNRYRLTGCLDVRYEAIIGEHHIRKYRDRPPRTEITTRYRLHVTPNEQALAAVRHHIGWRLFVTNAPAERLTLTEAVRLYRGGTPTIERLFARLKGRPLGLRPLFVRRDDALLGLSRLMSLALRVLTLLEFVVHRSLTKEETQLAGLVPGNPKLATAHPTTERILHAFGQLTLSIIELDSQRVAHITPLSPLQLRILQLLKLSETLYSDLARLKPISV